MIVSTAIYHAARPDFILAVVTGQTLKATAKTDYILQDWQSAGLHHPSAVRMFLFTLPKNEVTKIGELSKQDWSEVQKRMRISLEF